jgi:spore maturation protein CgeB
VRWAAPVSFLGNHMPERAAWLAELARPVRVWGNGWDRLPHLVGAFPPPEPVTHEDKRRVYGASSINLHLKPGKAQVDSYSSRVWEAPLCGGFVLAERTKLLTSCFREGEEIASFGCVDEAREKIDFYLARPDERARLVRNLVARLRAEHAIDATVGLVASRMQRVLAGATPLPEPEPASRETGRRAA